MSAWLWFLLGWGVLCIACTFRMGMEMLSEVAEGGMSVVHYLGALWAALIVLAGSAFLSAVLAMILAALNLGTAGM